MIKRKLLRGIIAGAIGGLAMKAIVQFVDPSAFGLSSQTDENAAQALWRSMNWPPLMPEQAKRIGAAMHYGLAVVAGALYAPSAERFPAIRTAGGAAFGAVLWAVGDELAVSMSGLENFAATPARSHLSALAAHVLYGITVDLSA